MMSDLELARPVVDILPGDVIYHQSESEPLLVTSSLPSHGCTILTFSNGSKMCLWSWWKVIVQQKRFENFNEWMIS
jgi:hypothetical protein